MATMIASLVFATEAAKHISKVSVPNAKSWKDNSNLKESHNMFTWISVGGWIAVALIFFGLVVFLFSGGKEKIGGKTSPVFVILLLAVIGVTITIGVLSILGAENLNKAPNNATYPFDTGSPNYNAARKDSILTASLAIGVFGLIVLMGIMLLLAKSSAKKSKEKAEEAHEVEEEAGIEREKQEVEADNKLAAEINKEKIAKREAQQNLNQAAKDLPKEDPKPEAVAHTQPEHVPEEPKEELVKGTETGEYGKPGAPAAAPPNRVHNLTSPT